jgi:Zn-dependent protease/predicted transcriptional regulator
MTINPKPFYLGRVFGIPIRAHYSWLPVFPFYAWAIAEFLLPRELENLGMDGLPGYQYWALGFMTSFLLFASVLAHELSHALMARAEGFGTGNITLYMFGGLASLEGQPAQPSSEFKIAIVGPAASFALGLVFYGMAEVIDQEANGSAIGLVLRHLGLVNWFLAGFNILPGMPLDGGRVLRALLWRFNKNFHVATQLAVRSGFMIAFSLVALGVYSFLYQERITGLWSIAIGLMIAFMLNTTEGHSNRILRPKRGTIKEVMNPDVVLIPPNMKISDFIDKVLKNNHHTSFPVAVNRRLHGLLLLEELKSLPEEKWPSVEAHQVMRPVDNSMFLSLQTPVETARTLMAGNGIGRAVVIDSNGLIVGYLTLNDVGK